MCISWNFLPFASTSISTGVKNPGIADDASSTSRNSLIAASSPFCAIAPMSQTTRRPAVDIGGDDEQAAALVVLGGDAGDEFGRHALFEQATQRPGVEEALVRRPVLEDVGAGDGGDGLAQLIVELGAEEGVRREQRADAHAGDDGEVRPLAGLRPAGEQAGSERAVGAATRHRQPRPALGRQHLLEILGRVAPDPRVGESGNDRGRLRRRRCRASASADLSAPSWAASRPAWSWSWPLLWPWLSPSARKRRRCRLT